MMKHLLWVTCVFVTACGGGGGVSVNELADKFEDAQCDVLVRCEGAVDKASCTAAASIEGRDYQTILDAVGDGTIIYDEGAAKDCIDAVRGQSCSFEGFYTDDPCQDVFQGTVPTGGACAIDLQCADFGDCVQTDPQCDSEIACCPGTCMGSFTESAIGGPCEDGLHFCSNNAYCKSSGAAGVCTALVGNEGGACDAIDACANPMYCNIDFMTGTGTCKTAAPSGGTCSRTDLLPCADGREYCDAATMKCVKSAAVGAACPAGVSCVDYASCINSVCVADLKAGEACQIDAGADCMISLECIGGTCQLPPVGTSCL